MGKRPRYVAIANTLAAYAISKASAIACRLEGRIESAQAYEEHCESYYERLPDDIKW